MKDISCVYAIVNLKNGKRYIGSTVSFVKRIRLHRHYLRRGAHQNRHLQAAWNKYGEDAFVFGIIEEVPVAQMISEEQRHLDAAQPRVYNLGKVAHPAMLGLRGRKGTTGKKMSPEAIAKVRAANLGRKRSDDTRAKLRAGWVRRRERLSTHCKNGHEFTADNTYLNEGKRDGDRTHRLCLTCRREAMSRFRKRHPDRVKAMMARWHAANRSPLKLQAKAS